MTTFLALIGASTPVLGFLPILSFLLITLKDPKFFKISCPDLIFCIIISIKSSITFLSNSKYASSLKSSVACAVIVKKDFKVDKNFNYLKTDDPYLAYAKLSSLFDYDNKINIPYIDKSAVISDKSSIDKNVYIGPNVFIGPNCEIGPNVIIHANCSIVKNVKIDNKLNNLFKSLKIDYSKVKYIKGWFQNTIPDYALDEKIASVTA